MFNRKEGTLMARPKKRNLDYFPHLVHEDIKSIIEKKLGIQGYTCYYKLQEQLADSDNHYLDLRDELKYEYFLGEINIEEDVLSSAIEYLIKLKYFDSELWEKQILWSDTFVMNIADTYNKRKSNTPVKPELDEQDNIIDVVSDPFYSVNDDVNQVNGVINTQIKGKETKLDNIKQKKIFNSFKERLLKFYESIKHNEKWDEPIQEWNALTDSERIDASEGIEYQINLWKLLPNTKFISKASSYLSKAMYKDSEIQRVLKDKRFRERQKIENDAKFGY